ncbi:hypothetical protein [Streptomyces sp. CA2R101]|uniref:hypothetical protein n=1 Tax=Streptomyces sp. CA2R101 TaxID=3120152 RepID=UPI00300900C7
MTYIVLEEAFIIPELFSRQPSSPQKIQVSDQYVKDWGRRLGDFEEHRLPDMDAHGIDIQILSLSVPGIQADTDAGAAVDNAQFAKTSSPGPSPAAPPASGGSPPCPCRTLPPP